MAELAQKLGIKLGYAIALLDAPAASAAVVRASLPQGVTVAESLADEYYDVILFWPTSLEGLNERFAALAHRIVPDGAIWSVIPKKQFAQGRGIGFSWAEMQGAGLRTDLVDNKECSVTPEEYATRFVIRKEHRHRYG
ncbi:MAG TPA: hypothetical protein VGP82_10080 [Ktedonobacterales bacterium]|nr:hypothetical protein [Ktedonobacterales bacterium]